MGAQRCPPRTPCPPPPAPACCLQQLSPSGVGGGRILVIQRSGGGEGQPLSDVARSRPLHRTPSLSALQLQLQLQHERGCCLLVACGCRLQASACVMPLSLRTAGAMYRGIAPTAAWAGTAAHMLRCCRSQQPHSPAARRRHRV